MVRRTLIFWLVSWQLLAADPTALMDQMKALHQGRKWKELIEQFGSHDFSDWPPTKSAEALQLRGQIFSFTKDGKRAEADLLAALKLTTRHEDIMLLLAENYVNNLNDDTKAIAAFRNVIEITGTNNKGWQPLTATCGLARLYTDQVKLDAVLEVLKPYGDLSQLPPTWRIKLLRCYGHLYAAQGREAESLAKFREALSLETNP
jgi:tetratricopeptide (TPR) repeat protein